MGVFENILVKGIRSGQLPGRSKDAIKWYRQQAKKVGAEGGQLMRETRGDLVNRMGIGHMYMFFYDSKMWSEGKEAQLPFYDRFPCIFYLGPSQKHKNLVLGINLHYLPFAPRAKLMDALYTIISDQTFDERTKLRATYGILKSATKFKAFRPCLKAYDKKHFRSKFLKINSNFWDIAIFLPTAQWQGASQSAVYRWSRSKIR